MVVMNSSIQRLLEPFKDEA